MTRLLILLLTLLCACGSPSAGAPDPIAPEPGPQDPAAVELPLIVAEGDSITGGPETWARQLTAARVVNVAVPGDRLRVMVEDAAGQVDPLYEPGAIATLFAGTNDLKAFSVSSEWLIENTQHWVDGRLAVGFKVAVFNMLPRGNLTAEQLAARDGFNDALVDAVPGALVIDVCEPAGAPDQAPMWRGDGIHPAAEGHAWMLEKRIRPALERLAAQ